MIALSALPATALSGFAESRPTVSEDHFGGNFLFNRDRTGPSSTYDDAVEDLRLTAIRIPGGTMAETIFDLKNPDATRGYSPVHGTTRELTPLSEMMGFAADEDLDVSFVLPTAQLFREDASGRLIPKSDAHETLTTFLADFLSGAYGDASVVQSISLGNEYWLGAEMNDAQYLAAANFILPRLDAALKTALARGWIDSRPDVAIQVGQYGRYAPDEGSLQDQRLRDGLTPEARAAITAVTANVYQRAHQNAPESYDYLPERMWNWANDPRFGEISFHVGEWNTMMDDGDVGLGQASSLISLFATLLSSGVDEAYAWPIQQNTDNELAYDAGTIGLTPAGVAYRMLAEALPGMRLEGWGGEDLNGSRDGAYEIEVQHYSSVRGDGDAIFVMSRWHTSYETTISLDALTVSDSTATLNRLTADNPLSEEARARVDVETVEVHGGVLRLTLAPGEVVRVDLGRVDSTEIDTGPRDPRPEPRPDPGPEPKPGPGSDPSGPTDFADVLTGSGRSDVVRAGDGDDTVRGLGGNDRLFGDSGEDVLRGDGGKDRLFGGHGGDVLAGNGGSDRLEGGPGNDEVKGHAGKDRLSGDEGSDTMHGGGGKDRLVGGDSNDLLRGDAGNDRLVGDAGSDTLIGGPGRDTLVGGDHSDVFVFAPRGGADVILDLSRHDRIDLTAFDIGLDDLTIRETGPGWHLSGGGLDVEIRTDDTRTDWLDDVLLF